MFDHRTQSRFRLSPKASSDREFFLSLSIKYGCHFDTCIPKKILDMSIAQTEDSVKPGTSSSVMDKAVRPTNITEAVLRQKDLYFIQQAAHDLIEDLVQRSSFSSLKEHFDKERRRREAVLNKLNLPNDLNLKINRLRKSLATLKDTQRKESCRLNNLIYHFRNEILEVKERTSKEAKFMEKIANMKIGKNRKFWQQQAAECDQTRESLLEEIDHEMNRNCSMVEIIHTKIASVKELLTYWTDKYETERDILIAELDILKEDRQKDLYRLEELNILTSQYMPIVEDFRRLKSIQQSKSNRAECEHKMATRIQAWWKGTMVRRQLGRFHPSRGPDKRPSMKIPKVDLSELIKAQANPSKFPLIGKSFANFTRSYMEVNKKFNKSELNLKPSEVFTNLRQMEDEEDKDIKKEFDAVLEEDEHYNPELPEDLLIDSKERVVSPRSGILKSFSPDIRKSNFD
ncbi:dynein regulatory complex protein 9-like isoform X2 [Biomphalaria glabrata]|nr:dynein regulatory complex protein 9-like isoform X2 [Biomphalaria glabrata]